MNSISTLGSNPSFGSYFVSWKRTDCQPPVDVKTVSMSRSKRSSFFSTIMINSLTLLFYLLHIHRLKTFYRILVLLSFLFLLQLVYLSEMFFRLNNKQFLVVL